MDVSKSESVRYDVTWQALGDPIVELEIMADNQETLDEAVTATLKLATEFEVRIILTWEGNPITQYCLDIKFFRDEDKRLFLEKLPTVQ